MSSNVYILTDLHTYFYVNTSHTSSVKKYTVTQGQKKKNQTNNPPPKKKQKIQAKTEKQQKTKNKTKQSQTDNRIQS